jgi:4-amino-4-deoxy-L-arabinose transferase-like glycosyltransferase
MNNPKIIKIFLFLFVLYFTFVLRVHNYERVPTANHLDEMLYAWSGLYLIEEGVPVSWSTLDYPARAEVFRGEINYQGGIPKASVVLYKPWLDEPPLFSLLVGYFAHLYQAEKTDFVPASYIRMPVVIISTLVSIMIFLIVKEVDSFESGILAMAVYGLTPLLVFASRTAMPENLIALLYLLILYLVLRFRKSPKFYYVLPMPLLAGLAGLAKPTGYFLLPFAIFWIFEKLYKKGQLKLALQYSFYLIVGILPFIAAYFWYGNHFDPEIFKTITNIQSHRPVGFGSLAWFFISPAYDTAILKDSWYIFALLSAAYFIFKPKLGEKKLISFAFVYWIIVVMISGGESDLLPWYRFPAFPLLAILSAWGLQELVKRANFFASFLGIGLLLGNRLLLVNAFHPNVSPWTYRLVFSGLMAPSLAFYVLKTRFWQKATKGVIVGVIGLGLLINTIYIYQAFDIACESKICPIVQSTWLSEIGFPFLAYFKK